MKPDLMHPEREIGLQLEWGRRNSQLANTGQRRKPKTGQKSVEIENNKRSSVFQANRRNKECLLVAYQDFHFATRN